MNGKLIDLCLSSCKNFGLSFLNSLLIKVDIVTVHSPMKQLGCLHR